MDAQVSISFCNYISLYHLYSYALHELCTKIHRFGRYQKPIMILFELELNDVCSPLNPQQRGDCSTGAVKKLKLILLLLLIKTGG